MGDGVMDIGYTKGWIEGKAEEGEEGLSSQEGA